MQRFGKLGRLGSHVLTKVAVVTAVLAAAGCGMQPYEPPNNREDPPGPGLFSGKGGEFVIYRKQEPAADAPADESAADEASAEEAPTDEKEGSEQPQ